MTHPNPVQSLEERVSQLRDPSQTHNAFALVDAINDLASAQINLQPHSTNITQLLQESFDLAQQLHYSEGQVKSLITQSWQFVLQGKPELGMPAATQAIELAQNEDDLYLEAIARYATALVQTEIGSTTLALENLLTALALVQETGDISREAHYRTTIGWHYLRSNQPLYAAQHFAESVRIYRAIHSEHLPSALNNLALVRLNQDNLAAAHNLTVEAMQLFKQDRPAIKSALLHTLGKVYVRMGESDRPKAQAAFQQALALLDDHAIDDAPARADLIVSQAKLLASQGLDDPALRLLLELADNAQNQQRKVILAQAVGEIYRTYKHAGQLDKALAYCERYDQLRTELETESAERQVRTLYILQETREARRAAEVIRLKTVLLEQKVQERTRDLERTQMEMLQRLAMAVETRDAITGDHVIRVGDLSAKIAQQYGLPSELVERIQLAARLHDLGKIGIPDNILMKTKRLDAAEYQLMKTHTIKGAALLANSPMPLFRAAQEIALTHHEHWDGRGYPYQLKGDDIPITGRIVAVADAFDAMTSMRPYKGVISVADAIAEIIHCSGTQFDPNVVQSFLRVIASELNIKTLGDLAAYQPRPTLPAVQPTTKTPVPALAPPAVQSSPYPYYWSVPLCTVSEPIYTASISAYYE